jgi:hypothetical protein
MLLLLLLLLLPQCASAQCVNGVMASSSFQQLIEFVLFLLHCRQNQQLRHTFCHPVGQHPVGVALTLASAL